MRIIRGRFKGLALTSVGKGDASAHLRPTTDRVRESLFSILEGGRFGAPIEAAVVLDLFAGTGALGLEALSRGASQVTFVENGRTALKLLTANIEKTRSQQETTILRQDATRLGPCPDVPATLVFLDPPYGTEKGALALTKALEGGWASAGALVVWEEAREMVAPKGFVKLEARRFGQTWLTFLRVGDNTSNR
ncbi:MAG: 16S rRNA (guanine(966)-N(2))-methyltransferase RsmD [Pseudomonadota bacterium]